MSGTKSNWKKLPHLLLLSCHLLIGLHSVRSQVTENSTTEIYILAFMNITTDDPTLGSFQQMVLNAYEEDTAFVGTTWDSRIYINMNLPYQGNGNLGMVFDNDENLVSSVENSITKLGFFGVASKRVSIQMTKSVQASTDGYYALPLTHGSTEFFMVSYGAYKGSQSTYAIAAAEHGTCIEVYSVSGPNFTRMAIASLDEYDVFNGLSEDMDFSGVYVNSTKPISVFSGHMCGQTPVGVSYCDHMISQMPPIEEYGTEFIIPSIKGRLNSAGYFYRVLASVDDTEVFVDGESVGTISRGTLYYDGNVDHNYDNLIIRCSEPCLVVQYNSGYLYNYDGAAVDFDERKMTDPYMTVIPSTHNYEKDLRFGTSNFYADGKRGIFENWVALIVPTGNILEITLNLTHIPSDTFWVDLSNGYSVANIQIPHGITNVRSDSGMVDMMAFVYGHGLTHITAYGYPGGFKMRGRKVTNMRLQRQSGIGSDFPTEPVVGTCEVPFNPSIVSSEDTLQRFYVTFELENPLSEPCASQALKDMAAKLANVKNTTNWLICLNLLCVPADSTWVYAIDLVEPASLDPLTSMTFLVSLWSSETELMKNAVACKRHVAEFLSNFGDYSERWQVPHVIENAGVCPLLDFVVPATVENQQPRCAASYRS